MSKGQNITRKLKAILSADVKGYSLLMADDEVFTLRTLLVKFRALWMSWGIRLMVDEFYEYGIHDNRQGGWEMEYVCF